MGMLVAGYPSFFYLDGVFVFFFSLLLFVPPAWELSPTENENNVF